MDAKLQVILRNTLAYALDRAEETWGLVGPLIKEAQVKAEASLRALPSEIPGHPIVEEDKPRVDDFVCVIADLRKSTEHLLELRPANTDPQQLERVFYETSALLPVCAETMRFHGGGTTEYLGDGTLSFFRVPDDAEAREEVVRKAYTAASECLEARTGLINPELERRYKLPPIDIGIGMAYGKAVVTVVGSQSFALPKAIGRCVYKAKKLCSGTNTIRVDGPLKEIWPTSEEGWIQFGGIKVLDVTDAFEISVKPVDRKK